MDGWTDGLGGWMDSLAGWMDGQRTRQTAEERERASERARTARDGGRGGKRGEGIRGKACSLWSRARARPVATEDALHESRRGRSSAANGLAEIRP